MLHQKIAESLVLTKLFGVDVLAITVCFCISHCYSDATQFEFFPLQVHLSGTKYLKTSSDLASWTLSYKVHTYSYVTVQN